MGLRVDASRGQGGIEAADRAGDVAAVLPAARSYTSDLEITNRQIAAFDVNEQRRRQHLYGQRAEQTRLADPRWTHNQNLGADFLGQALVSCDDLHRSFPASARAAI